MSGSHHVIKGEGTVAMTSDMKVESILRTDNELLTQGKLAIRLSPRLQLVPT